MKFTIQKEDLLYAVSAVERAVSSKNTMPELGGIMMSAVDGRLSFRATDLELAVECLVNAQVVEQGEAVVPGKRFAAMVRLLPSGEITLSGENQRLQVQYSSGKQSLPCFEAGSFPVLPPREGEISGTVPVRLFRRLVRQIGIAAAQDEVRPIFTGIYTLFGADKITMVATDTHRLAWGESSWQGTESGALLIPNRSLQEVLRLAGNDEDSIIITASKSQVFFSFANISLTSRLIMGQYPDFQQVIPDDSACQAELMINRPSFIEVLERASLISRESGRIKGHVVRLETTEGQLIVSADVPDEGTIRETADATCVGDDVVINFNARYLLDVLKALDEDTVRLRLTNGATQGVIRPVERDDYLYLLLPVRVAR